MAGWSDAKSLMILIAPDGRVVFTSSEVNLRQYLIISVLKIIRFIQVSSVNRDEQIIVLGT